MSVWKTSRAVEDFQTLSTNKRNRIRRQFSFIIDHLLVWFTSNINLCVLCCPVKISVFNLLFVWIFLFCVVLRALTSLYRPPPPSHPHPHPFRYESNGHDLRPHSVRVGRVQSTHVRGKRGWEWGWGGAAVII